MVRTKTNIALAAVAFVSSISNTPKVHAASASVNVSITFAVAPIDLFNTGAAAPEDVRTCNMVHDKVQRIWSAKTKRPALHCVNVDAMPLIVTPQRTQSLIVRP